LGCFSPTCLFFYSISAALCVSVSIWVGDLVGAIGDLSRAAVAVVHRDHVWDVVQLHRRSQVVPERHRPGLEGGRHHADRSAGESALAVFADHAAAFHVFDGQLGKTRSMQVSSIAS
jgi:hypothetical protein